MRPTPRHRAQIATGHAERAKAPESHAAGLAAPRPGLAAHVILAVIVLLASTLTPKAGCAQESEGTEAARLWSAPGLDVVKAGKWTTLVVGLGAAGYGFVASIDADDSYSALEAECARNAALCVRRRADGTFIDAEFESRYQEVLRRNRRAKRALVTGQAVVAASIALFVVDLGRRGPPPNIPYDPERLGFAVEADGRWTLRVRVPVGGPGRGPR